ncbi:MAG: hypothetical protein ACR2NX_04515, partial [Chthoniobacterales bacterium]
MLDHEDLKLIASTSTELNSMLQQISRYADLARQHKGQYNYVDLLGERVETASKQAQSLFDHVTSAILSGRAGTKETPRNRPAPAPAPVFSIVPQLAPSIAAVGKAMAAFSAKPAPRPAPQTVKVAPAVPSGVNILNPKSSRELILFVDDEAEISELAA